VLLKGPKPKQVWKIEAREETSFFILAPLFYLENRLVFTLSYEKTLKKHHHVVTTMT